MKLRNLVAGCLIAAGNVYATAASAQGPIGFATLNGGTTGGAGGNVVQASTGTEIHQAICERASDTTPLIIEVEGTITPGNTAKVSGSCNTQDGVIELKEISNITLIGVGSGALFDEIGIHLRTSNNIILRNLHVRDVKKSGSPTSNGGDAIGMESDVSNVWVDHCTLTASGGESDGFDSLIDMKNNVKYVTVSYNHLQGSDRGGLVGSSESDDENDQITFHHNYYQDLKSRMPLLRYAQQAHSYNNYFNGISGTGINSRRGAKIRIENNYFENSRNPIGSFFDDVPGFWQVSGNFFANSVTWESASDESPAGPNVTSTTTVNIPYSYELDDTSCIPQIVQSTAGANTGMQTSDGSCTVVPTSPPTVSPPPTAPPTNPPNPPGNGIILEGNNLSIGAGSDGSSKASGSSFGNVRDGNLSSSWSPNGNTGRISVKWGGGETVAAVKIIEASDAQGNIGNWQLINNDNGAVLASGNGAGTITFNSVTLDKLNFVINSASGTPKVAEFETYAGFTVVTTTPTPTATPATPIPTPTPTPTPSDAPPPTPTPDVTPTPGDGSVLNNGENLSIGAGSDGSSKASGSSYGNVRDGDLSSFWSPSGSTGRISIKWGGGETVAAVNIIETPDAAGNIGAWQLVNNDNDNVLASGNGAGVVTFNAVTLNKLNFVIQSASGTPKIAEFETYADFTTGGPTPSPGPTIIPTPLPSPVTPTSPPINGGDCEDLINDPNVNWRESNLQSDQAIVECLSQSLGTPVGFGENATGGFNPGGGSNLVIITDDNPEEQLLAAVSSTNHNWIVFDKDDFRNETAISMHRLDCSSSAVQSALDANENLCRDPFAWCSSKGVSSSDCLEEFYNERLNDSDLPIRNQLIDSNTTIDGRGANAYFLFNGFKIGADSSGASTHVSTNVIVTNMEFRGAGHIEDHGLDPDMLRVTGESHDVWIHQNTFSTTGDAAFDLKVGAYDTTISFNKLINVKRASLHGSSDSRTINAQITSTMHNNLFVTLDDDYGSSTFNALRRIPLLRRGQTHLWNNVFYNYRKDIASVRVEGRLLFEDNMVVNNQEEAEDKSDELSDFTGDGLFDLQSGGQIRVNDSDVWFADSNCNPIGSPASLDQSSGSVPDMNNAYNSASRNTISSNRFDPGNNLLDYVKATAGKGGATPWVSSYADSESDIIASAPSSCQP